MKKIYLIFLFPFIVSCSVDESAPTTAQKINIPKRNLGIQISMDGPRGSIYVDSTEKVYAFRSYAGIIKNDTLVPIKIEFEVPNTWTDLQPNQGQKYIRFLLPDSMTPEKQYDFALDNRHVSPCLNNLINTKLNLLKTRTFIIQPNEPFYFRLGFLVIPDYGLFRANLFSQVNDSLKKEIYNDLRLYVTMGPVWSETSIGHLTFLNK